MSLFSIIGKFCFCCRNNENLVVIVGTFIRNCGNFFFCRNYGKNGKCPVGIMGKYPSELWEEIVGIVGPYLKMCLANSGIVQIRNMRLQNFPPNSALWSLCRWYNKKRNVWRALSGSTSWNATSSQPIK
jgi:hypothetical protein